MSILRDVMELNITGCTGVTDVSTLYSATSLNLTGCINVTDVSTLCNVPSLILAECTNIPNNMNPSDNSHHNKSIDNNKLSLFHKIGDNVGKSMMLQSNKFIDPAGDNTVAPPVPFNLGGNYVSI